MKSTSPLFLRALILLLAMLVITGCTDPATKKVKFLEKGRSLFEKAEYGKARLELKNALKIDPEFAEAYYWLGMVELKSNDLKAAFGSFGKAVELQPGLWKAQLELGKIFMLARMPDKAREKAEKVLALEPAHRDGRLLMASVLLAEKKVSEAKAMLDQMRQEGERQPELYALQVFLCFQDNDPACADAVLQDGLAHNPDSVQLHSLKAALYSRTGKKDGAIEALKTIIRLEPDKDAHRYHLAGLYWDTGRTQEAADLLQAVIDADLRNEDKRIGAARFYMARQKADEAEKILKQAAAEIEKSFGARLVLSELYAGQGRVEDATAILKESLDLSKDPANPGILNAKNALARIYFASGEVEKAANYTDEVLNESPRNVDAGYTRGRIALVRNDPLNAVSAFRNVVGERPDFVMAQLSLAEALRRNNQNELALDSLRQALAANPASKELGKALARAYLINGDAKNAEAQLRRIVGADPQDMSARADLGDFLLAQNNEAAAKQVFAEIKTAAPSIPLGYLKLAGLHASAKAWDQAAAVLEAGYAATPQSAPVLQGLAEAYLAQNKRDKAVQLLRKRLSENPKEAFTLNLLGKVHFAAKDVAQAEAAFKGAIDAEPMWPEPYNNLAGLYMSQGKTADAVRQFNEAVASNPRNPSAYMALGFIHQEQKNYAEAMRIYEQGVANVPNFWGAYNNLAFLLAENGRTEADFKRALELARKAQRLQPERLSVADTVGWAYYKMGNFEQALAVFSELLAKVPEDPVLNYHAGMVLFKAGRTDEAKEKLQAALAESKPFYGREDAEKMLLELKAKG